MEATRHTDGAFVGLSATAETSDGHTVEGEITAIVEIADTITRIEIDNAEQDVPLYIARERVEVGR